GSGIANRAVCELARQRRAVERRLAPRQLPRLPRSESGAHRRDRLGADRARVLRVLLEEPRQRRIDGRLDETLDARVAELRLGLSLELRVAQLDRDDSCQPFTNILAVETLLLLQKLELLGLRVQRARQRAAEAGQVRAALDRVDVVGEGED